MSRALVLTGVAICAVGALTLTRDALAGTISVSGDGSAVALVYRAQPGEKNEFSISLYGTDSAGAAQYLVSELGARRNLAPGPGCLTQDAGVAICTIPGQLQVSARIYLGDQNDSAELGEAPALAASIYGGGGDDRLEAPGNDRFGGPPYWFTSGRRPGLLLDPGTAEAQAGSSLIGGSGGDSLIGGPRADVLRPGAGKDYVEPRGGSDRILARDGSFDLLRCAQRDLVDADRFDLAWGLDCQVRRGGGAFSALPLGAAVFERLELDRLDLDVDVGCSSDAPAACRGTVTYFVVGGRTLLRKRFWLRPGTVDSRSSPIGESALRAIERHETRASVRTIDNQGERRTVTRDVVVLLDVGEPD